MCANEFKHKDVGGKLEYVEYDAVGGHIFNSQATGDILYASSATQLSRLGVTNNRILISSSSLPAWSNTLPGFAITDTSFIATGAADGDYFVIKAIDDDGAAGAYLEVAKVFSANDPYFSMGGSQEFKFYNSGVADLGGYVSVGSGAPRVKMVKITGTSPAVGASGTIAHGLADRAKMLRATVLVANNTGNQIPPNFTSVADHEFDFFIDSTNVYIYCIANNSSNIDGNAVTILIDYEE